LSKYSGYLLNKTRYERFIEDKLRKSGHSLKGSATIEVFEPEDSEEEGGENEDRADDGGDAGEQDVEAEPPAENNEEEAPAEEEVVEEPAE